MLVKVTIILPNNGNPRREIKCIDCNLIYSFRDYEILRSVKKLNYLNINGDTKRIYCHDCCIKRMISLKSEFEDLFFLLIDGQEQRVIDLR